MIRHAVGGGLCRAPSASFRGSGGAGRGRGFLPRPGCWSKARVRQQLGRVAPGSGHAGDLDGESLVEEVGLEGGGQRQSWDLSQALLPQGQAHRAAAEIHEGQGFGWGNEDRTEG